MDSGELRKIGKAATFSARSLASLSGDVRNKAISNIADGLSSSRPEITLENARDIEKGREKGFSEAVLDRLLLNYERIDAIARDVLSVVELPDPVGETIEMNTMPNGLEISRRRVPLGVIGVIYESRPNVTVDISALCLKSGNAVILRGGSEAFHSNTVLADVIRAAILDAGISKDAVQIVGSTDRKFVSEMLKMDEFIDLMIPRGGADLVARVAKEASMPSITGGVGVCHTYVDESASLDMAVDIVFNAKVQRPSVCNALDTMLVHVSAAPEYLPKIANAFAEAGVEMRCDTRSMSI
ncbi:MAG: glutamate-5-semialdehyde dehydrogenase, partial [Chloroflexota bacterium]|nr:glutamate-5-semialdehyde dehydrogenase [Chloroflexota bacterium]